MAKNFMSGIQKATAQIPSSAFSEIEKIKKQIVVLDELKQFITPLTTEELDILENNLKSQGCKDPLAIWETTKEEAGLGDSDEVVHILVDGHNRYSICTKYNIDFKITVLKFENIEKVKDFMIDYQLGRRNLTPEQLSFFRGLRYNREKGSKGKYDREEGGVDISKTLANEFNVSQRTIKNDGNFAKGISKLTPELQHQVLSGNSSLNRTAIQDLGKRDDISEGTLTNLEKLTHSNPSEDNLILSPYLEEFSQRKKEIARLVTNLSSQSDYSLLVQKVKELKSFVNN